MESLQKKNKKLKKRIEQLEKELRKYVNENTSSDSIPPYLKKLEDTVNRFAKDEDNNEPPKGNPRNTKPEYIDKTERHSLENPTCPDCGSHARRRGLSTRKQIMIEIQLPKAETVEHKCDNKIYRILRPV